MRASGGNASMLGEIFRRLQNPICFKPMKIYVVVSGQYSDFGICCVCSTQEKADEALFVYGPDSRVCEYEVDDVPKHPKGKYLWLLWMNDEGDTTLGPTQQDASWRDAGEEDVSGGDWEYRIWAVDSEAAVKIANEKRTIRLAIPKTK